MKPTAFQPHPPLLTAILPLLLFAHAQASETTPAPTGESGSSHVAHVVFVWLKTPGDAVARQKVIETTRDLERLIPGLSVTAAGEPLPSERPVVDDSFDVGLVMVFDSPEHLAAYDAHPAHKKAVSEVLVPTCIG